VARADDLRLWMLREEPSREEHARVGALGAARRCGDQQPWSA
jgi:hypothetical protein